MLLWLLLLRPHFSYISVRRRIFVTVTTGIGWVVDLVLTANSRGSKNSRGIHTRIIG